MDEEAGWETGGVEVDAHVGLGWVLGQDGSDSQHMRSCGIEVVDVEIDKLRDSGCELGQKGVYHSFLSPYARLPN